MPNPQNSPQASALKASIKEVEFFVRSVRMRLPFRFGSVTLRASANLHVRLRAELADGRRADGFAADMLAPKWFDKDPAKDHVDNIRDLIAGARHAAGAYGAAARQPAVPFEVWEAGYAAALEFAEARSLNRLTACHGASLLERALIDAVGRASGCAYHSLLRDNLLGIDMGRIHPELRQVAPADAIAPTPLQHLQVRHTVGLVDPIRKADIAPGDRIDDGLPQALEDYVEMQGLRYYKIKVGGDVEADCARLRAIAAVLDAYDRPYQVTLDGNEQYGHMEALVELLDRLQGDPALTRLWDSILYIEQPLDRSLALDAAAAAQIRALSARKPMLIDESDEDLQTFRRAVDLGYLGVSSKACKGMIKALLNQALVRHLNRDGGAYFVSGEDLTNVPLVALHQDLAHLAALGVTHAERNGHHYVRGLDHLSAGERRMCVESHAPLYTQIGDTHTLNVRDGGIDLSSLTGEGLGGEAGMDLAALTPLDAWDVAALA